MFDFLKEYLSVILTILEEVAAEDNPDVAFDLSENHQEFLEQET